VLSSSRDRRPFGHNTYGPKIGGCAPLGDRAGSPCKTMWPGPRTTSVPSGILIHLAVWPQQTWAKKWGLLSHLFMGEMGPHLTQCGLSPDLPHANWHLDPSSHLSTIHLPKSWGLLPPPLFGGGNGSPSNTMSPGPRPASIPCGSLIQPAVWPQQTWAENWGSAALGREELGPHLTQCGRGRGLSPCQVSS